jgi:hypothetical protein
MPTHRRAKLARGGRRAARAWVVRALRDGAEVRGRMVKGEGGGARCCAGGSKKRPRAGHANAPPRSWSRMTGPCLGCTCPAQWRGGAGENGKRGKGAGLGCCAGSERATTRRACLRTAAQMKQADAPPVLYVPCAMARRCGGERLKGKGAGQAAARGAKWRPRAGHANAWKGGGRLPHKAKEGAIHTHCWARISGTTSHAIRALREFGNVFNEGADRGKRSLGAKRGS